MLVPCPSTCELAIPHPPPGIVQRLAAKPPYSRMPSAKPDSLTLSHSNSSDHPSICVRDGIWRRKSEQSCVEMDEFVYSYEFLNAEPPILLEAERVFPVIP